MKLNFSSPLVDRALAFATKAHAGQTRKTGEPYITHAIEAANTIASWKLDDATIAAALLHDVAEDTPYGIDQIEKEFGKEVAFLVNGVTKLGKIKYRGVEAQVENLRKMVLAMAEDIRVVLIKLADRLHNMKTLGALPPQKQKRIALETSEIYAPLAYRLGMQNLSGQLRDLSFPYLHPKEYTWLIEQVKERYESRVEYLETVKPIVEKALRENGVTDFKIDFRAKRYSSLYKKMFRYNMDMDNIYDLVAFRIVVPTVQECYGALGVIHSLWPPLPSRIKDYIAMPKPNGYRSIHTTVFCLDNRITEFQIRTDQMHDEAEHGIAAHWSYKEHGDAAAAIKGNNKLAWVNQLRHWQQKFTDPEQFMESLKIDFFKDRLFVATPKGEVVDLPVGATPIDFAYKIHSQIGDSCVGAKVNGKIVVLDFELHSGDIVQIMTQKNKKPSESWLRFTKTHAARDHIKSALRDQKLGGLKAQQRKLLEFKIVVDNKIGVLKNVSSVFSRSRINITRLDTTPSSSTLTAIKINCESPFKRDKEVEPLIVKIKKVKEVKSVEYRFI